MKQDNEEKMLQSAKLSWKTPEQVFETVKDSPEFQAAYDAERELLKSAKRYRAELGEWKHKTEWYDWLLLGFIALFVAYLLAHVVAYANALILTA